MFEVGRVCVKIAGRDANNYCVVVKKLDDNYVIIEGNVRRRKCNIKHLHPQKKKLDIKEDATYKEVAAAFKKAGIPVKEKRGFKWKKEAAAPKEKAPREEKPVEKPKPKKQTEKKPVEKKAKSTKQKPKKTTKATKKTKK